MSDSTDAKLMDIWEGYDDFEEGGIPYVLFVIQQDIDDIRSMWPVAQSSTRSSTNPGFQSSVGDAVKGSPGKK